VYTVRTKRNGTKNKPALWLRGCKAYSVEVGYDDLVLLRTGLAGYTGSLQFWRENIAEILASGKPSFLVLPTRVPRGSNPPVWQFE
jgi:hypothetical protein